MFFSPALRERMEDSRINLGADNDISIRPLSEFPPIQMRMIRARRVVMGRGTMKMQYPEPA